MVKTFKLKELGYEVTIHKFAKLTNGAAWLKKNNTIILSAATMADSQIFQGFLPLSVDYREQFSSIGKIPGGYLKREGKSSDKEILTSRLIDRALRPLFPEYFFNQIQIISTLYSLDKTTTPSSLAILASSLSLVCSDIPFLEPIGAVQVCKKGDKIIIEPTTDEYLNSDFQIVVAGTANGILMVEGSTNQATENEIINCLYEAHKIIIKQVEWQNEIAAELKIEKNNNYIDTKFNWKEWSNKITNFIDENKINKIFEIGSNKSLLNKTISELEKNFFESNVDIIDSESELYQAINNFNFAKDICKIEQKLEKLSSDKNNKINFLFDKILKEKIATAILDKNIRVDGRSLNKVREIYSEVGLLPSAHGSALFQRGQTQALVSCTLGSGKDAKKEDDILQTDPIDNYLMLHYNFPPFSVGEVKSLRGPGRRDIGHGFLAFHAIKKMLPTQKEFPYTIRLNSDILESNGSSSMATVCGSTLALMDAGVKIKEVVGGIAMGLLSTKNSTFFTLTDITGFEDSLGLMDFKVAGTINGITAIQMDVKHKGGLSEEVFKNALNQAKEARLFIISEIKKTLSTPRAELAEHVPIITSLEVDSSKIGAIIGSGGKTIKEITEKTSTTIDIVNSTVNIFGQNKEKVKEAIAIIEILAGKIEAGLIIDGKIAKLTEFGLFIDIAPGKSGLLHISKIERNIQNNLDSKYKVGEIIKVKVLNYDKKTDRISLDFIR